MKSTMQDVPLSITALFRRGAEMFPDSEVITFEGERARHTRYATVAERTQRLAGALRTLGVVEGDRVATLCWNHQEHLEAYFAVPCMGAVLHTLNLRLPPSQLAQIINHAEDRVVIVDDSLAPLLASVIEQCPSVEKVIVVGSGAVSGLGETLAYEDLIAKEPPTFDWPELDESSAASMCYTTGTTGDPKGVAYSHRSVFLHSFAVWANFRLDDNARLLTIVPMFHVNAWGMPYAGWMVGGDQLMPGRFLQPQGLCEFIRQERPTFTGGVPTILTGILHHVQATGADVSSITRAICGGSAVPATLITAYRDVLGIELIQAWGMTETSPIGSIALPPKGTAPEDELLYRSKTGRAVPGVELRIVDDTGAEVAHDGDAVGEIEVRGPWITASYYNTEAPEKFHDGWLRTGDVGSIDARGYVQITDRSKDVIKSGGEWISSVELETLLVGHPAVAEAAVVGVHDDRWAERPLALVVLKAGASATPDELREFLAPKVARWWLPERWAFVDELPKTSVGKLDKKLIRSEYGHAKYSVVELEASPR
ncbi:MAG TPA: long-chain fatty acid--CoA ligase [Candidatus Saccharimonadales bacterium]|nr:long-chain fatty acid--CoA ligase [Candidatus Saccharimonadales bacterium]